MSCASPSEQEMEILRKQMGNGQMNKNVRFLLRGGYIVKTDIGNIQVGIPPETIKDCMKLGITMPSIYVVPRERIDRKNFLNISEFEFPTYFNFFFTRKKVRIVCSQDVKLKIKTIFQETLLGPVDLSTFDKDFDESFPKDYKPNMRKELDYFAVNPFTSKELTMDTMIQIETFDDKGECLLDDKIRIVANEAKLTYDFYDENKFIASTPQNIQLHPEAYFCHTMFREEKARLFKIGSGRDLQSNEEPLGFTPPFFGVTILGSSHGFDCNGSTTGFILWINQRGVMVDPPPFAGTGIREFGVPPNLIDKIIVTHCHADHDTGCFQKLLMAHQIEIVTTPTIMGCFQRKYSAITGQTIQQLKTFFIYRPVIIGSPVNIDGAELRFFYTFHSVPCIGFEVLFFEKSIYFSGDTFYHPEALRDLYIKGIFTRERYEALTDVNWMGYDIILHEAGIPPIHTPTKVLNEFSAEVKEKQYLIHIAEKDVPTDGGLKFAKPGLENTLILPVYPAIDRTMQKLDLLSSIDFFNNIPLNKARDLIRCCKEEEYNANQIVIREGTHGNKFYIIMNGIAKIYSDAQGKKFKKYAYAGDYFGETSILSKGKRAANVVAYTNLKAVVLQNHDFNWVFGITGIEGDNPSDVKSVVGKLQNQSNQRLMKRAEFINLNKSISAITELQKNTLNMLLSEVKYKSGDYLWTSGNKVKGAYFIWSGSWQMSDLPVRCAELDMTISKGNFISDFEKLIKDEETTTNCKCIEDGELYFIERNELWDFFSKNPGFLVQFNDSFIIR